MHTDLPRTVCWVPLWNKDRIGIGLEHLLLSARQADSVLLGVDPDVGAFRLVYRLSWAKFLKEQQALWSRVVRERRITTG